MNDYLARSKQLLGDSKINALADKVILVAGVGGVGGTALEALARSGFKKFILVDYDQVDVSNLNRQVLFTNSDIGKDKVSVAKEYILKINDEINVKTIKSKIGDIPFGEIIKDKVDFIIDAIDYVPGKLEIYEYAIKNNIPFVSSLGMGNRINPEDVTLTTLHKTENDPLAKKIRYEARHRGIDVKKVPVVFSKEQPLIKSAKPASMIMVPSTAGLLIAKYVLTTIK